MATLEIACFNYESAVNAYLAGADRIELCEQEELGGISPNMELLEKVLEVVTIPVNVMIRPRGGDFVYNDTEFEQMKQEIKRFKNLNINGFVFGVLTRYDEIDMHRNLELVRLAHPFPCTFHRAFDKVTSPERALEELIALNFSHLLTSGTKPTAEAGSEILKQLVYQAENRLQIIVGGKVRSSNLAQLVTHTHALEFHSSALVLGEKVASIEEIQKMKTILAEKR